ncbi:MAG: bifunctional oligoribonuclease/PAP phosphatase NrnA [Lachnospiraceae bacterium]|nr:bifunctional oligoribonuclease/PAP phosphatase NrnA [Lachnospiraceae bacterium]
MNFEQKKAILDKIKEYDRILLFRHLRIDGDCVGSTKGLKALIKATWPEKEVYIIDNEESSYLSFMGPDDEEIPDEMYAEALGIVLDTGNTKRISNQKFTLCKELVKIDHHIPLDNYGDHAWVEEERSSTCEMVVNFYDTFKDELVMTREAAQYLYTGMVTDSGRFRFRSVSGDTMRYAGLLLDQDIDTDVLYANLYLEHYGYLKFKAEMYKRMKITENGVAYLYISKTLREKHDISLEAASAAISLLDSIRGCLCWMAFIETGDEEESIRVRLRSRFVHINQLAEQYRGGGHACASGATVYNRREVRALLKQADALVKEYKETHEGWL